MIEVTFILNQLNIQQTQNVHINQRIDFHIRHILHQAYVDLSDWDNFQCSISYSNVKYGCDKTFEEIGVANNSKLSIKFSKTISIEILNKQFPSPQQYQADAFDRIKMFQEWIIKNHLRNIPYEIIIIDATNGKSIKDETWIQNSILQSIPVLLLINVKQNIQWQGNSITHEFNIFQPFSQLIQNIRNQLKINNIISLQYQSNLLKPELLYFTQNIPLNVQLLASIPNELTYRVSYQQQKEQQINCKSSSLVGDIIKQLRSQFQIKRTSQILLKYHWTLENRNTFGQEDIPNFSLLKLLEVESQGEFQIILKNIGENVDQQLNNQILFVSNDTYLSDLQRKIALNNNEEVMFYLDQSSKQLDNNQKMQDLDVYFGAAIMYKINNKQQINNKPPININSKIRPSDKQIQERKFGLLVVNANVINNMEMAIQNKVKALDGVVRYKYSLPINQIVKFSIGTRLLKDEDNMEEILDGKFQYIQAIFQETIDIHLKYLHDDSTKLITVQLEETLEKISQQLNLKGNFKKGDQSLAQELTFSQLEIFNGETIIYEKTTPTEEESKTLNNDKSIPKKISLHLPSPLESKISENNDQQREASQIIPQNLQPLIQSIICEDVFIKINAQIGGRLYKFKVKGSQKFEFLKSTIYDFLIQGDPEGIKQYQLFYDELILRDDATISSLNKLEIDVKFRLKSNSI